MHIPRILCIGSAHLDILSVITGDPSALDRIGRTSVEVGGTACNVAINLARLGAQVSLLTALDDGALSDVVKRHIAESGVDLRVIRHHSADRSVAAFCAHLDADGEMISAVSSMPAETARFSAEKTRGQWDAVFIDANLHGHEIARLTQRFQRTRVFLAAVSEEKSLRLRGALQYAAGVFINARELRYFTAQTGLAPEAISVGGCVVFHTRGADGADVWVNGSCENVPALRRASGGNRLGAGDALAASVIYHQVLGAPAVEAIRASMAFAAQIAESITTNTGQQAPLERALEDFRRQAFVDTLTGIPNRSAGLRHVDAVRRDSKKAVRAVAIIDVDRFKSINDEMGHDAGDLALKAVASAVMSALRRGDFGCRWGGEEFCCVIDARDESEAVAAAERLRKAIEAVEDAPRRVTASVGVALWEAGASFDDALIRADQALYAAKNGGRNRVEFSRMAAR